MSYNITDTDDFTGQSPSYIPVWNDDLKVFQKLETGDVGGGSKRKIFIDKIPLPLEPNMSVGLASVENAFIRYAPRVYYSQNYFFTSCKFLIFKTYPNREILETEITFSDFNDINTWLQNNIANDGTYFLESVAFYMYDIENKDIQPITEMNGLNTLMSSFKGGSYKSGRSEASECSWGSVAENMFADVYNELFGTSLVGTDFASVNSKKAVWLPVNPSNFNEPLFYSGNSKQIIMYPQATRRYAKHDNDTFYNINNTTQGVWQQDNKPCYLVADLGSVPSYSVSRNSERVKVINNMKDEGMRGLICYAFKNDHDTAIMFKNMGIDAVVINSVDFAKYDLEVVQISTGNNQSAEFVKVITGLGDLNGFNRLNQNDISDQLFLNKRDWQFYGDRGCYNRHAKGNKKFPNIYFRLRDKVTKEISELSKQHIGSISKARGFLPFGQEVKNG